MPHDDLHIRPGEPGDAAWIAALIADFHADLIVDPADPELAHFLASVSEGAERGYLASPRYRYRLALRGSIPLGFIALRDGSHVFHLFVARAAQRQGVAWALWQGVLDDRRTGEDQPRFTVNASLAAVSVYRAFGFEPVGEVQRVHGIAFLPMQRAAGGASAAG